MARQRCGWLDPPRGAEANDARSQGGETCREFIDGSRRAPTGQRRDCALFDHAAPDLLQLRLASQPAEGAAGNERLHVRWLGPHDWTQRVAP